MAIDPSVFDKLKTFEDYNKADQAFQIQKALQAQQMQGASTQNQLQQFQLNRLQSGQLSPEEMVNARLKLAEINAQNPSILLDKKPITLEDIMGNTAPPGQAAPQPTPTQQPDGMNPMMPALVQQESGGNPNALSPKGAAGAFQIMPTTAAQPGYGVTPLRWWDGKDPRTAPFMEQQRFANDYANAMQRKFGDNPQLAAAAYNAGPGAVGNAMQATGGDPQAAISQLPAETQNYVPKVAGAAPAAPQVYHTPISEQGQQLLSQLQPQYRARVQGMIDGQIPLPPAGSLARSGPEGKLANQIYDMALQIDPTLTADRFTTLQKFNHGPESRQIKSFSVGIDHLNTLSDLADALNNGDTKLINAASNAVATQLGKPNANNFEAAKQIVADEIIKAVVGAGGGQADRENAQATINAANSPEQLKGVIDTYKKLMGGQLEGLKQQYETGTGRADFYDRLAPGARAVFSPQQTASAGKINPVDAINELKRRKKL